MSKHDALWEQEHRERMQRWLDTPQPVDSDEPTVDLVTAALERRREVTA